MKNLFPFLLIILYSFSLIFAQPIVDGDLSDPQYVSLATKLNSNSGLGWDIDVTEILFYPDLVNSELYLGMKSKLDNSNDNGIGLWLNFSELNGANADTSLRSKPWRTLHEW